jgi:hypothetical protein
VSEPRSLTELLERLRPRSREGSVRFGELLSEIGENSFAPVILVPALLLISPLSAIPGMPTLSALIIITVAAQWVVGRRHLWLPRFVTRRSLDAARLARALTYLERPAAWVDRMSRDRLQLLVLPPLSLVAKLCVILIPLSWPILELLPMVTSLGASAVTLFVFGLMVRDGIFVVAGFAFVGLVGGAVYWLGFAG